MRTVSIALVCVMSSGCYPTILEAPALPTAEEDCDQDGVERALDCDDDDPTSGALLLRDDFGDDDGSWQDVATRGEPWAFTDESVKASPEGQEALLAESRDWTDVSVRTEVTIEGKGLDCTQGCQTDRWRAGVVGRALFSDTSAEGFTGYRCALARNDAEDSYAEGFFLQLAAFTDDPDDDVLSESTGDHTVNPSFDQLGRADHDCGDISAGDRATITLRMSGDSLVCTATIDGCPAIEVRATDDRFRSGTVALSTLNARARFGSVQVCEAL